MGLAAEPSLSSAVLHRMPPEGFRPDAVLGKPDLGRAETAFRRWLGPEAPWALVGSWSCLLVLILPSFLEMAVDRGLGLLGRKSPVAPPPQGGPQCYQTWQWCGTQGPSF